MTAVVEWDDVLTLHSTRALSIEAMLTSMADTGAETRKSDWNALLPFEILGEEFHCVGCADGPLVRLQSIVHYFIRHPKLWMSIRSLLYIF